METRKLHRDEVVTGVVQNNRCEFIHEDAINGIDLRYEEALREWEMENPDSEDDFEYDGEMGDVLIGFKWNDETQLYEEDPDAEYCAIVNYDGHYVTQVTMSKYAVECHRCSPCYPGQGDVDTPGDSYIAFCPPPDAYGDHDDMDKSRIFKVEFYDEDDFVGAELPIAPGVGGM